MKVRIQEAHGKAFKRHSVKGWDCGVKYFAATQYRWSLPSGKTRVEKRKWVLTHLPTGRRVSQAMALAKCRKLAKLLCRTSVPWAKLNPKNSASYGHLIPTEARKLMGASGPELT